MSDNRAEDNMQRGIKPLEIFNSYAEWMTGMYQQGQNFATLLLASKDDNEIALDLDQATETAIDVSPDDAGDLYNTLSSGPDLFWASPQDADSLFAYAIDRAIERFLDGARAVAREAYIVALEQHIIGLQDTRERVIPQQVSTPDDFTDAISLPQPEQVRSPQETKPAQSAPEPKESTNAKQPKTNAAKPQPEGAK